MPNYVVKVTLFMDGLDHEKDVSNEVTHLMSTALHTNISSAFVRYAVNEIEELPRPQYYECGSCGAIHSMQWHGDCRDDSGRFTSEELDEHHGAGEWDLVTEEEQLADEDVDDGDYIAERIAERDNYPYAPEDYQV